MGEVYQSNNERNGDLFAVERTISIATMTFNEQGNGASSKSLTNYKVLRVGDIAFEGHTNANFRYGRFVLNDLDDGIMSPRFISLRPTNEQKILFWKHYINFEPIMRNKLANSTKAGTMMNELVITDLFNQSILVPILQEQEVIGDFFKHLDNLITPHQRDFDTKFMKILRKFYPAIFNMFFVLESA